MALLDGVISPVVTLLVDMLGTTCTLIKPNNEYNPLTGTDAKQPGVYMVKCTPPTEFEVGLAEAFAGNLPKGGKRTHVKWIVPVEQFTAIGVTPEPDTDSVEFEGITRRLVKVSRYYEGSQVAALELECVK